jgi:hypothetical protein
MIWLVLSGTLHMTVTQPWWSAVWLGISMPKYHKGIIIGVSIPDCGTGLGVSIHKKLICKIIYSLFSAQIPRQEISIVIASLDLRDMYSSLIFMTKSDV